MKKMILLASMAIAGVNIVHAQLSINPEAGINIANMSQKAGDTKLGTKSIIGYKVGAVLDIDIAKGFYIQPGAFYSTKGSEYTVLGLTTKTTVGYIEVPVNIAYRYDFGNAGAVFAAAGPYIGIGMTGKNKTENVPLVGTLENDIKFGSKDGEMKKIDYGANFSVGYISPIGIYVRAQYGLGLANLSNTNNSSSKNRVWGFSLGYAFQLNER